MHNQANSTNSIKNANTAVAASAIIIQGYANYVKTQSGFNISTSSSLMRYKDKINSELSTAKSHANSYLNKIQPRLIKNIDNIGNFYALYNAIATSANKEKNEQQWIESLSYLNAMSLNYQQETKETLNIIKDLANMLRNDSSSFQKTVDEMNIASNGSEGKLKVLNEKIHQLQEKYNHYEYGLIAIGVAISIAVFNVILAQVDRVEISSKVYTRIMYGSSFFIVTGFIGFAEVGSKMLKLHSAISEKINERSLLKTEVKMANAISLNYKNLSKKAEKATTATDNMEKAWQSLRNDLMAISNGLKNKTLRPEQARYIFLNDKKNVIPKILADIATIKSQLNGINIVRVKPNQSYEGTIKKILQSTAA